MIAAESNMRALRSALGVAAVLGGFVHLGFGAKLLAQASPGALHGLPEYNPAVRLDPGASLTCSGAHSIERLVARWAALFRERQPGFEIALGLEGTATAIPTLTGRKAQIGLLARSMRSSEAAAFADQRGYKPTAVPIALEAVAVVVHRDNPLRGLTLEQLDAVFSRSRRRGAERSVEVWQQLGVSGPLQHERLQLLTREPGSTTLEQFVDLALNGGDLRPEAVALSSPEDLVRRLERSPAAIGFAGLTALTPRVRALALGLDAGALVLPDEHSVRAGTYPLTRTFTAVVDQPPGRPTEPVVREFLRFALSREGQAAAIALGFIPVSAEESRKTARILN